MGMRSLINTCDEQGAGFAADASSCRAIRWLWRGFPTKLLVRIGPQGCRPGAPPGGETDGSAPPRVGINTADLNADCQFVPTPTGRTPLASPPGFGAANWCSDTNFRIALGNFFKTAAGGVSCK